jgi:HPt (histidine-containing phosphotransfer) domain-containing protein
MHNHGVERETAEQPPGACEASIDREVIEGLRAIMPADLLDELIDEFVRACSHERQALVVAIQNADPRMVHEVAHRLRGSCAALGATHLTALCAALEANARADSVEGAQQFISELDDEFQRVRIALDKERSAPTELAPAPAGR